MKAKDTRIREDSLPVSRVDPILVAFLEAQDEVEAERLMGQLITEYAVPLTKKIVRARINLGNPGQESEDIAAEVSLQLVRKLREMRANPSVRPISDFRGYVAVTAYNACYRRLRSDHPERSRLRSRIRYLMTHWNGFAIWEDRNRDLLCGLAAWQREERPRYASMIRPSDLYETDAVKSARTRAEDQARLLSAIFDWSRAPIELNDLVDLVAGLDHTSATDSALLTLTDRNPTVATTVERRLYLQRLWREIIELPIEQRHALLLNLRDGHGRDLTTLLVHARIATMAEVAKALAVSHEEIASLWSRLPLDDATIASRLGIKRQQVINLRTAARRRLLRRMKKLEEGH